MRFLLDSDFISQPTKKTPNSKVVDWLHAAKTTEICVSVVTLQETQAGIDLLDVGQKRTTLEAWFLREILSGKSGAILPMTLEIAVLAGKLFATARRGGHTAEIADVQIGATALVHGLTLATLNRKHYARLGVPMIDP